ncbi:hypothetical protein BV898_06972 [Hypsibius exemplaris]|uniref:Lysosomal dipeptide transporter MFSD1 n=1 Tax=Hypsibius exemplaris TaxID=2072580 RepID=A0A1W0WUQ6_HYPEX|nr:hypothetical protein BV898_06972 [Hypsibius exemplaris]
MNRWVFLFFSSLTFFTAEFFVDQSAPLVSRLSGTAEACNNGTDNTCLDFTATQFNSLFVAHFWAGGLAALCTGFIIGKFGVWFTSCGTAGLLLVGLLLFTIGPYSASTTIAFWVMLFGRLIFALGYFAQIVLSHQVKAHWFFGRELGVAYGIYHDSSRLSMIFAYASLGSIVRRVGLQNTLWITFAICMLAPICAITAGWIYKKYASNTIDTAVFTGGFAGRPHEFGLRKCIELAPDYWIIAGMIFCYFGGIFTTLADFPKYLTEVYGYSETKAGQLTGIIPDIAIITPLFGYLIDRFGRRDIFNFTGTLLFFFGLIGIAFIPGFMPPLACLFIAISFAIMTVSFWSSIPVITPPSHVGVAMGIGIGLQALAAGLLLLITGFLLDQMTISVVQRWMNFFILLATLAGLSWLLSGASIYLDRKNPKRPLRRRHQLPAVPEDMAFEDAGELSPLMKEIQKPDDRYAQYSPMLTAVIT